MSEVGFKRTHLRFDRVLARSPDNDCVHVIVETPAASTP